LVVMVAMMKGVVVKCCKPGIMSGHVPAWTSSGHIMKHAKSPFANKMKEG